MWTAATGCSWSPAWGTAAAGQRRGGGELRMPATVTTLACTLSIGIVATCVASCGKYSGDSSTAPTAGCGLSFFVTSAKSTTGNIGGLRGADALCQNLAQAVGAGNKTWRAYLSGGGEADKGERATHAPSRLGTRPGGHAQGGTVGTNPPPPHPRKRD